MSFLARSQYSYIFVSRGCCGKSVVGACLRTICRGRGRLLRLLLRAGPSTMCGGQGMSGHCTNRLGSPSELRHVLVCGPWGASSKSLLCRACQFRGRAAFGAIVWTGRREIGRRLKQASRTSPMGTMANLVFAFEAGANTITNP